MLGLYASLFCWANGFDGCRIERGELERLLGLSRFKGTRVDWIADDLKSYFAIVEPRWELEAPGKPFSVLFLSRVDVDEDDLNGLAELTLWRPVGAADARTKDLGSIFRGAIPDERSMTAVLALVASGQLALLDIPGISADG